MESTINEIANGTIILMTALISLALAYFTKWIRTKTSNEYLCGVMERLEKLANMIVKDVQQTVADELKKASKDGKLSREEMNQTFDAAFDLLKKYLGPVGLAELIRIFGIEQTDDFLKSKIEEAVHDINSSKRPELKVKI